ncbi:hypothetical protein Acr_00g0061500 [Actinidia rufa]|uniref:Cyclin-dependent protein kinase inhibitor SMR4 n=1 Tax=Actinidia rufa TaxID=165716 RepID=A0A7J0DNQ6_9ERIC|nr:hypothetical protein Acr_00g0061500 [Actinidia rufa]
METEEWSEVVAEEEREGCWTPKHSGCRIPAAASVCPQPPKKKRYSCRGRREPPKNGYFHPPELEIFFAMPPRRQARA